MAIRKSGGGRVELRPAGPVAVPGGGQPLPDPLRRRMEAAFAPDFSAARVHVGHQATHVGVVAYALGEDLRFATGRYDPASRAG